MLRSIKVMEGTESQLTGLFVFVLSLPLPPPHPNRSHARSSLSVRKLVTTLLAVGSAVSILPPVIRKVLPQKVTAIPVSAPIDAVLAKAFPKVR